MARYTFNEHFEKYFVAVCQRASSMAQAATQLEMNYKTVRFHAKRLGCFKQNQAGKGSTKRFGGSVISLSEIFNGTHSTYQSHKLKRRLVKEGHKNHQCERCGLKEWQGFAIPLELHHVDGNKYNNALSNLSFLCPNCHALTNNYRARNIKNLSAPVETRDVESPKFGEA